MTRIGLISGMAFGLAALACPDARAQAPAIAWFSGQPGADGSWTFGGQVAAADPSGLTVDIDLERLQAFDSKDFPQRGGFVVPVDQDGTFFLNVSLDPAWFPAGSLATAQVWSPWGGYSAVVESVTGPPAPPGGGYDWATRAAPTRPAAPRAPAAVARLMIMADKEIFLEAALKGSGKHGIKWTEGPARAKKEDKPQGQFKTQADLDFVLEKAKVLGPGKQDIFDLPKDTKNILHQPDGTNKPAKRVYIKVYDNGKVHAFPCTDDYVIQK